MKGSGRGETGEGPRIELKLDTAQILLVIAGLLALCATSFFLGRWTERDNWREAAVSGPSRAGKLNDADAGADLTFFDKLGSRSAEPARQTAPTRPATPAPAGEGDTAEGPVPDPRAAAAAPSPTKGNPQEPSLSAIRGVGQRGFALQVFAGDRAQADRISASLVRKGYVARVLPGTAGPATARVRVYGYPSRVEADRGAERLRHEEKLQPWVVKAD